MTDFALPMLLAEAALLRSLCVSALAISVSVCLHAAVMRLLYEWVVDRSGWPWVRLTFLVLVLVAAHVVEILVFGVAYHGWADTSESLTGAYDGSFTDAVYFSAAVYTTVGFGDITPLGYTRFMVGLEALIGLMLIAWSASFTFFAMSKLCGPTPESADEPAIASPSASPEIEEK